MEHCACCDRLLSPIARMGTWCEACTLGLQTDAILLSSGDADEIQITVAWLLDHGCLTLAHYVARVPFEVTDG